MINGDTLEHAEKLKRRTKLFALRVITMFKALPRGEEARIMGRQVLRLGTSIGANYRAACRARTVKEFVSKIRVAVEEADETSYWLELLTDASIIRKARLEPLHSECNEFLAIPASSQHTAECRSRRSMIKSLNR
ncbi:MAG TPA: four helix bundle protein [Tepidisphaeraceae bacterium]|jgi:four helix bundle protein|nr:four helix bundle protein [Tepidisphaeraceae bacterium]